MLSIAVDLDGVLANTMLPVCRMINQRHFTHFEVSSFVRWKGWEIAKIAKEEFFRTLDQVWFERVNYPSNRRSASRES